MKELKTSLFIRTSIDPMYDYKPYKDQEYKIIINDEYIATFNGDDLQIIDGILTRLHCKFKAFDDIDFEVKYSNEYYDITYDYYNEQFNAYEKHKLIKPTVENLEKLGLTFKQINEIL